MLLSIKFFFQKREIIRSTTAYEAIRVCSIKTILNTCKKINLNQLIYDEF
jgi:hypothetical protein